MIPTTTLFTKTRNRRRHFMQLRSNPDFRHGDFEMFSRVWRSIESLFLTSGLRKNYAREFGIRSVPQYQKSPNLLFWGLFRGGRTRKIGHYAKIRYGRGKDIYIQENFNWTRQILRTNKHCSWISTSKLLVVIIIFTQAFTTNAMISGFL